MNPASQIPLLDRPLIALSEISQFTRIKPLRLRSMCALAEPEPISIGADDALTPNAAHSLLLRVIEHRKRKHIHRHPRAKDRISLLLWMCGLDGADQLARRPPTYAKSLDTEISRIARLPEPHRTAVATELLSRFVDASAIANGVRADLRRVRAQRDAEIRLGKIIRAEKMADRAKAKADAEEKEYEDKMLTAAYAPYRSAEDRMRRKRARDPKWLPEPWKKKKKR